MIRIFQIAVLSFLLLFPAGCNGPQEKPIWEDVKITDLAAVNISKHKNEKLKNINFMVYFFEIPAENTGKLEDVWPMLYTKPLKFNNYSAFSKNFFSVGYAQTSQWDKIRELLMASGGKKVDSISLLVQDGQSIDILIRNLRKQEDIFYVAETGTMERKTLGPGKLLLRIKVEKVPEQRGVCNVYVYPMFSPPAGNLIPLPALKQRKGEFVFSSTAFELKMGSSDFLFLAPQKYIDDKMTLSSFFFARTRPEPVIRTILLVCTKIDY